MRRATIVLAVATLLLSSARAIPAETWANAAELLGTPYLRTLDPARYDITEKSGGKELEIRPHAPVADSFTAINFLEHAIPTLDVDPADDSVEILHARPLTYRIVAIRLDFEANTITIDTESSIVAMDVIPDFMTFGDVGAKIVVARRAEASQHLISAVQLVGTWGIGTSNVVVMVTKDGVDHYALDGTLVGDRLDMASFYLAIDETPSNHPSLFAVGLDDFTLVRTTFAGVFDAGRNAYAVCFTGTPTIDSWADSTMTALYNRDEFGHEGFAFAVTLETVSLVSITTAVFNGIVDISAIPILGSVSVPKITYVYSSAALINQLPGCLVDPVPGFEPDSMPNGVALYTTVALSPGQSTSINITVDRSGILAVGISGDTPLTFGNFIDLFIDGVDTSSLTLPPGFPNVFAIGLVGFSYNSRNKTIAVALSLGDEIVLIANLVTVTHPLVEFEAEIVSPYKVDVAAKAFLDVGSSTFTIFILPDDDGGFVVAGSGDALEIGAVMRKFSASFLPSQLSGILASSGLDSFEIRSPELSFPLGVSNDYEISFLGEPVVAGWSGVTVSAVVAKQGSTTQMAVGFHLENTKFGDLIKKLTGLGIGALSILDQSMKTSIIISKSAMPGVRLPGNYFSQMEIKKGVMISASFDVSRCNDAMCAFLAKTLGAAARFELESTIESASSVAVGARVANVPLGDGVTLADLGLEFQIGSETSFALVGALELVDPPLKFVGRLETNLAELTVSMTMIGIWDEPFGAKFVAFGDATFSATILPAAATLTAFSIGGTILLGSVSGKELEAKSYVGIDTVNPTDNYFYGSINHATIESVLDAFGVSSGNLPSVLAESGFPHGLEVSFAYKDTSPVEGGVVIEAGFKLNGTMNILGFSLSALIVLDFPSRMEIEVAMSPLNLANGLLKMYRSANDKHRGPILSASFTLVPFRIDVVASGYVNLLNGHIKNEAELEISNGGFRVRLTDVPFFGFRADSLTVGASWGSLREATFGVAGVLSSEWINEIKVLVIAAVETSANKATAAINAAKAKVDKAQDKVDDAQDGVDDAKGAFDKANDNLDKAEDVVKKLCSIKNCGSVCIGCLEKIKKTKKVWGKKITYYVFDWNNCCTRITDPTCIAANKVCSAARTTANTALSVAKAAVSATKKTLTVAEAALKAAKATLTGLKATLSTVQKTYELGAAAATKIVSLGLSGIIRIREITFDVEISVASGGSFAGTIEAKFFDTNFKKFGFELNLKDVAKLASNLASHVLSSLKGRKRRRRQVATMPVKLIREEMPRFDVSAEVMGFKSIQDFGRGLANCSAIRKQKIVAERLFDTVEGLFSRWARKRDHFKAAKSRFVSGLVMIDGVFSSAKTELKSVKSSVLTFFDTVNRRLDYQDVHVMDEILCKKFATNHVNVTDALRRLASLPTIPNNSIARKDVMRANRHLRRALGDFCSLSLDKAVKVLETLLLDMELIESYVCKV